MKNILKEYKVVYTYSLDNEIVREYLTIKAANIIIAGLNAHERLSKNKDYKELSIEGVNLIL